jgi:4,5-dihydroxyphthalate decarboxylase
MMRTGDLQVAFAGLAGVNDEDLDLVDFFQDVEDLERDWYKKTGIYPLHGIIAVHNRVLTADPTLARRIYDAFVRARDNYWKRVLTGEARRKDDLRYAELAKIVGDPLPYGLEENRPAFDALIRYARTQKLIKAAPTSAQVFFDPRLNQTWSPSAAGRS